MEIQSRRAAALTTALVLTAATLAAPAPARAQPLAAGDYEVQVDHQQRRRFFLLHVPPQVSAGRPLPLVLNFHGGGGEPRAHQAWTGMDALADREGFIVVYPAGFARQGSPGRSLLTWNAGSCCGPAVKDNSDDVGFVRQVLIETNARVAVDVTRVYATGMSNGAMMSYRLAREMSDQVAAIAPVAGASDLPPAPGALPVPVLHMHSVDDSRALFAGGEGPPFPFTQHREQHPAVESVIRLWAAHNGCATNPALEPARTAASGHSATRVTYADCGSGKPVVLWRLTGAGHVWPGSAQKYAARLLGTATDVLNANQEIWSFFRKFDRPQAPALAASNAATSATAVPTTPGAPDQSPAARELTFSRSSLALHATGARDRFADGGPRVRSGALAVRASTSLWARARLGRDGASASGLLLGLEGRALDVDLPVLAGDDRFYRLGLAVSGFHLTAGRQLYWLQVGTFAAEQSQLWDAPRLRVYALGLATARLADSAQLIYGAGYTFDFGRGLPLPFLGLDWRVSRTFRLDVLLPVMAQLHWRTSDPLTLSFGTSVAGDIFRYRRVDAGAPDDPGLLRVARLRAGLGSRYNVASGIALELDIGVEGTSFQHHLGQDRAGGGYLRFGLVLGQGRGFAAQDLATPD